MLRIETKLLMLFHLQIDEQTEQMNQELEQYLRLFVDHRQKDWLEYLVSAKFIVNNKVYLVTKVFLFMVSYGRELRIETDIRRKGKIEKMMKFIERMKKI